VQSHQRQLVEINDELRQQAIAAIKSVNTLLETGKMPPAIYSQRCKGCSLEKQCLPQVQKKMKRYQEAV
jgi:CRISPR-associated exonuclease Cas4